MYSELNKWENNCKELIDISSKIYMIYVYFVVINSFRVYDG